MPNEYTPKATVTLKDVGPGFNASKVLGGFNNTYRIKRGKLNASVAFSDKTFTPLALSEVQKLKDTVATCDYKLAKRVTLNTKYELGTKKYQVGGTWDGKMLNKVTQLKGWYTNKDNLAAGEATVALNSKAKANVTFNQQRVLSAKCTLTKGKFTAEPSYNFPKKAPAVSVTARVHGPDTLKLAYDIKSEGTTLEYAHKPFKFTVATTAGKSLKFAKPTFSATYENTISF